MDHNKSLDEVNLIAALLLDVHSSHGVVFNTSALKHTTKKVCKRVRAEGISFLTKTLPRLGKAFDKALSGGPPLNACSLGFEPIGLPVAVYGDERDQLEFAYRTSNELPRFLGEFFSRVLSPTGTVLQDPCAESVRVIRQVLYLFYKYELDYTDKQEQKVLSQFEMTEFELHEHATHLQELNRSFSVLPPTTRRAPNKAYKTEIEVVREARIYLQRLFARFDPTDIVPRHGPGAVSTGERLSEKWTFSNVPDRVTDFYPLDKYYYLSPGHVCDDLGGILSLDSSEPSAKVILVPKDSRGPRLISCEPLEIQWIQQGLSRAIVRHVEAHKLSKFNVFFTDQGPNQRGALLGSSTGRYATLDLNEASDRVSLELVRLLFPSNLLGYLEACRSLSTVMPDGRKLALLKYAPMGSALCFPVLALTIYALLYAASSSADARESILVYGDDVIVPTAQAENAMSTLECFGLKVNRDKSCTSGPFRESCGTDAFIGTNVTPLRIRTVWSESRCPNAYASWIAYANQFRDRHYYRVYDYIVDRLHAVYGAIPDDGMGLPCPSLRVVAEEFKPKRSRINHDLQKREWKVWDLKAPVTTHNINGWSMLLRYCCEGSKRTGTSIDLRCDYGFGEDHWLEWPVHLPETAASPEDAAEVADTVVNYYTAQNGKPFSNLVFEEDACFSVSQYTKRRASMLVQRWR